MFLNPWYGPSADDAAQASASNEPDPTGASGPDAQPEAGVVKTTAARTPSTSSASSSGHETTPTAVIQSRLKPGWTVHMTHEGRLFYCK